ncbi:MAG: arginine N-succinyltransferase [Planctomycetota bacterium]
MEFIRAVQLDDLDQLWELITSATYGLTTLQISKDQLRDRVETSNFAFTRATEKVAGEPYVFVMEDTEIGKIVGLSCIFSKIGGYEPFYSYRRIVEQKYCELLDKTQEVESLHLEKIHNGPTEIGSLFLSPEYRGKGRGRLLSLCRFMFMAANPKRFEEQIIAEMRGVMSEDGACPFWEAIGRHFFEMDFPSADRLSTLNKKFIEDFMPRYPIYSSMLPQSAIEIMGEVHPNTRPALSMLKAEGFEVVNLIDIFDGGPVVQCDREKIDAVRRTQTSQVSEIAKDVEGERVILSTQQDGFRATLGQSEAIDGGLRISQVTALTLKVRVGDPISRLTLYPEAKESLDQVDAS